MAIGNFQIHTASISHVKRNYSVQISSDVATTRQHAEHVAPLSLPPPEVVTCVSGDIMVTADQIDIYCRYLVRLDILDI